MPRTRAPPTGGSRHSVSPMMAACDAPEGDHRSCSSGVSSCHPAGGASQADELRFPSSTRDSSEPSLLCESPSVHDHQRFRHEFQSTMAFQTHRLGALSLN